MTKKNSIIKHGQEYNYILNTAKTAADQAAGLREKRAEIDSCIKILDGLEEHCLEALKKLTGKDFRAFAMDGNYGRPE